MKAFLFVMILFTPDGGQLPPQREPMASAQACMERMAEMQTRFLGLNEDFTFQATCIQASKKADPA